MDIKKLVIDTGNENEYIRSLEIEYEELTAEYARAKMPFKKEHANPYGTMHGGILYSMADIVCGTAAWMTGYLVTTVGGSINYLSPMAGTEYVYCEARAEKIGKTLVTYSVELKNDAGKVVNTGTFTFFKVEKKLNIEG